MRWVRSLGAIITIAALYTAAACSDSPVVPVDAGNDNVVIVDPDGYVPPGEAGPPRLQKHDGIVIPAMQVGVVYVGDIDAGSAPNQDAFFKWIVASPYWLYLQEYGIDNGALAGSTHVATSALIHAGDVDSTTGLVDVLTLQNRIASALNGDPDAGTSATISLPGAHAYVFFLPDGLNVALGHRGTYTYQTCIDTNGYHGFDGFEPYTVLPPCDDGRTPYTASHELAEMATDPQPYSGWASDIDIGVNGGEVADLCEDKVMQEGVWVTKLWSNLQNGCVP